MPHDQSLLKRARRGQALVLACLSLLLLALMVALSFNLSHALREKTRLQQHSDAMAYSMAVLEARALNYFASSNRAIAASYVAMNSLHGYMAAANVTADLMDAGKKSFYKVAIAEGILCAPCFFSGVGCDHCPHILEAVNVAQKFSDEADDYRDQLESLDDPFAKAVSALDTMMDTIHSAQRSAFTKTADALSDGSSYGLNKLKEINAPKSSTLVSAVGSLNSGEFNCAIDGKICTILGKPSNSDNKTRAVVMTEVANATRPGWAAKRGYPATYLNPSFMLDLTMNIQGEGLSAVTAHHAGGKTVNNGGDGAMHSGPDTNNDGAMSASHEHGTVGTALFKHPIIGWGKYETIVTSNNDGGDHSTGHDSAEHKFEGSNTRDLMTCAMQGNCFMKFRADADPNRDFGQPKVYAYVTMKLRADDVKNEAPWQLNDESRVSFNHGEQGVGTVNLAANEGAAVSKALVYYHRLGSWKEQPNMFNPFWRAKLHPFRPAEAANVLQQAGHDDAADMAVIPKFPL